MEIKDGYNNKKSFITFETGDGVIRLWITQQGLKDSDVTPDETLSYLTLTELVNLRDACNNAIKEAVGL